MNRAADTTIRTRGPRYRRAFALVVCSALALAIAGSAPAPAQTDAAGETDGAAMSKQERKQLEKDERIREYLRKKEERRLQREQRQSDDRAAVERPAAAASAPRAVATAPPTTRRSKPTARRTVASRGRSALPRGLARAQANVRASSLGEDPTVQSYLGLIEAQGASPYQLAAFGNFIAQSGLTADALAYYEVALRLEGDDPTLWTNLGTLHRKNDNSSAASAAFQRALRLDPNNAVAHYNLGAILDESGRYADAIEAFKTALTLDPALGDPASNPQAANNERLLAVKLMLYQEQSGSLGLPLQAVDPNASGGRMR